MCVNQTMLPPGLHLRPGLLEGQLQEGACRAAPETTAAATNYFY